MSEPLYDFYMGALEAELTCAPSGPFSARMASYHCRTLLALEANPQAGTARSSQQPREEPLSPTGGGR